MYGKNKTLVRPNVSNKAQLALFHTFSLTLCSPRSTIGTFDHLPNLTFGTDIGPMQNELDPIVLHLWTQWLCLELGVNIH